MGNALEEGVALSFIYKVVLSPAHLAAGEVIGTTHTHTHTVAHFVGLTLFLRKEGIVDKLEGYCDYFIMLLLGYIRTDIFVSTLPVELNLYIIAPHHSQNYSHGEGGGGVTA